MSALLSHQVRAIRLRRGLSQAELARMVGVSRQALSAIEAGRQTPSTVTALRLAQTLGCDVESLFQLPGDDVVVELAAAASAPQRLALGRIDGRVVAHPLGGAPHSADGVLQSSMGMRGHAELFVDDADLDARVLVAGCAPVLGLLCDRLDARAGASATWLPHHSTQALTLLQQGLVHAAGIHFASADDVERHVQLVADSFDDDMALVHIAQWRMGLVVKSGNPKGVHDGDDLVRDDVRCVVRDEGAGAQQVLQRLVGGSGRALSGPTAAAHADVARLVRWDVADVGVAIESVAQDDALDFIPVVEERFDVVIARRHLHHPAVERWLNLLQQRAFRADAAHLPSIDVSAAGDLTSVSPHVGGRP